jgi:hypothetical protein
VLGFDNLRKVVGKYLITNTITVPPVIENEHGRLDFKGSTALFLPGIGEHERRILGLHYQRKFNLKIDDIAPRFGDKNADMPYLADDKPSCWPYWWLYSDNAFRSLVRLMGFRILDEWKWEDHTLQIFAEKL